MAEDYYTRKYEGDYSVELTEKVRAHLNDDPATTEAFFALHAQLDMLVEEHGVFLHDGEHQVQDDWTPDLVLMAVDEASALARQQNSPAWPAMTAIASAMRIMIRTASVVPSTEFKQDESAGVPPGLYALIQKEDCRPIDIAFAALVGDVSEESVLASAVAAERARCESHVKDRIEDLLVGRQPDELGSEEGWCYEQFERVRSEIACEQPVDETVSDASVGDA